MDELLQAIQEKTGPPAEQAEGAARAALDFLKERLPAGIGDNLEEYISGNVEGISDGVDGLTDKAKGLLGN